MAAEVAAEAVHPGALRCAALRWGMLYCGMLYCDTSAVGSPSRCASFACIIPSLSSLTLTSSLSRPAEDPWGLGPDDNTEAGMRRVRAPASERTAAEARLHAAACWHCAPLCCLQ